MAATGALFYFIVAMIFATATAIFIYAGAKYVQSGQMTLGELTLVIAYVAQIYGPIEKITRNINDIQSSITGIERVFLMLDKEKEVKEQEHSLAVSGIRGAFRFEDVSFYYNPGKPILKELRFEINPGDKVGVMGSTGAGKSTLISLLTRFYDPSAGTIYLDGTDICKLRLSDYRNQFAIVLQEPVLFSTTVAENIAYGRPGASHNKIVEAAKNANAHDFIMQLPDGYDTMVGNRGMQLSGGERQRISIARAFIKKAPVLILDEPTSSVDMFTESQIVKAMEGLMMDCTTFLITHRLDTLHMCNVILHLEGGMLVEMLRDPEPAVIERKKSFSISSDLSGR